VPRLLVATTNRHKIEEIRSLLREAPVDLATLEMWPQLAAPEETGTTFEENARLKATYYASATRMMTVAEDSGLAIDALGGAPGVQSARYGGAETSYPEKFALLYRALQGAPPPWIARFVCAAAIADANGVMYETRGAVEGRVAPEPRGAGGFGYDPIFFYPPYGRTLAEVSREEKATVSHRGQAFRQVARFLAGQHA
jgi:XTP/dITP diphosphohydrolase